MLDSKLEIVYINPKELTPYWNNARMHSKKDIEAIRASIREFGFSDPIGIWSDLNYIVEGHGRQLAAIAEGLQEVPCIRLDHMTDEQRKAYALAHNKTAELSEWNFDTLNLELAGIQEIDMSALGFEEIQPDWFESRKRDDAEKQDGNEEYNEFLEKFEVKKTTDDCYTPDGVYEAVASWVSEEYGVDRSRFVRPFYPGGDYKSYAYKPDSIVVDNPPFSILAEILTFYSEKGIAFFLFAPTLTLFSSSASRNTCAIPVGVGVTYENKACVNTSFVTSFDADRLRVRTAPGLYNTVREAADAYRDELTKELPKYSYPDEIITSPMVARWCKYGIEFELLKSESVSIDALDAQKKAGKTIFGKGFLLSERAAAERAAAERAAAERAAAEQAAAHRWELSEREKKIVESLRL